MTLPLRPYQQEALEAIEDAWTRGIHRPLVALPTGSGKTILFAHVASKRRGRTLILAHRDELIQQAAEKLSMVDPTLDIGVVKAQMNEHDCPVVVASVQTLSRERRLQQMRSDFDTVIVDEAHHVRAATYERVLRYCRSFEADGPLTLGVTATPERGDHENLGEVFEAIVYEKKIIDLIPEYLCDLRALHIYLDCDFRTLHTRHGEFIDREVEAMLLAADAPRQVAQAYLQYALGRKTIIFTPTVTTAYAMVEAFQEAGETTIEGLDATTPLEQRRAILRRFQSGETMIVANCGILTEGFDNPSVNAIILTRPTKSKVLYCQMIGRACRHYPGKTDSLIMDAVGNTSRHDLMTFAGLFDMKEKQLKGKTLRQAVDEQLVEEAEAEAAGEREGQIVAKVVQLFGTRQQAWVEAGSKRFALNAGEGRIVYLAPVGPLDDDRWVVRLKRRDGRQEDLRTGLNLGYAQGFAEDYIRSLGAGALVDRQASWRQLPASEAQLNVLRRARLPVVPEMTRGAASDLIAAASIDWR